MEMACRRYTEINSMDSSIQIQKHLAEILEEVELGY
jgi:hypothetical protein